MFSQKEQNIDKINDLDCLILDESVPPREKLVKSAKLLRGRCKNMVVERGYSDCFEYKCQFLDSIIGLLLFS